MRLAIGSGTDTISQMRAAVRGVLSNKGRAASASVSLQMMFAAIRRVFGEQQ
jgi:hypothetical protein